MKKIYVLVFFMAALISCDSESAQDCFQSSGEMITKRFTVSDFDKIIVNRGVSLTIKQGSETKIEIKAGKNLFNDINVEINNKTLTVSDNNTCNWVRDYMPVQLLVTSPNIVEIVSSTQYDVVSDGVLGYPALNLVSEDFFRDGNQTTGNFILEIDCQKLSVGFNNLSNCFIKGRTVEANIFFASGNSRFEGSNLVVQKVSVFHRSTNDIFVNPQQSIKGNIYSTGNVISKNKPPVVEVVEHYLGKLIFEGE